MKTQILSLGTALPANKIAQSAIADLFVTTLNIEGKAAAKLKEIFLNTTIKSRYSVFTDFTDRESIEKLFFAPMSVRNELYRKYAPELAEQAARKALDMWGGDPQSITHVLSVSCTGVVTPGLEFDLIGRLGLSHTICRLGVNHMGCFGAFKGISAANAYAKEDPSHRVLVVCTELCSLHIQPDLRMDNMVANALFSDGAAALVLGCNPTKEEKPLYTILSLGSQYLPNTLNHMQWNGSEKGLLIKLSNLVPHHIKENISPFCDRILNGTQAHECDWAIHPGGKAIVENIEEKLGLVPDQTRASWQLLAECGNMSSATVLFVLEKLLKQEKKRDLCSALGFGPGLSMESMVLKRNEI